MAHLTENRDNDTCILDPKDSAILAVETLRNAAASADDSVKSGKKEDRLSVFWRVFGTTILSIAALVIITVYQQFSSSLNDLRSNVSHLTESRGDLVKGDEFNNLSASMWSSIKELQADKAAFLALKERSDWLEQQVKDGQDQVNGHFAALKTHLKELETAKADMESVKGQFALLEQQLQKDDEERKELVREIQQVREREAALEGRQGMVPPVTPASHVEP
jgi:hypothetical protein